MMFNKFALVLIMVLSGSVLMNTASADVRCTISDFKVENYEHGGAYLHGNLGGHPKGWISLCSQASCSDAITSRRMAAALSAQLTGRTLDAYFANVSSCAEIINYTRIVTFAVN